MNVQTRMGALLTAVLLIPTVSAATKHTRTHRQIGPKAAERAALRAQPGTLAGATKLENEDGKSQYAVIVKNDSGLHEVMIDAYTGHLNSQEKVTAEEEAKEAAADAKATATRAGSRTASKKTHHHGSTAH